MQPGVRVVHLPRRAQVANFTPIPSRYFAVYESRIPGLDSSVGIAERRVMSLSKNQQLPSNLGIPLTKASTATRTFNGKCALRGQTAWISVATT